MSAEGWTVLVILLVGSACLGLMLLAFPHISRRGLLFGVYVGEEASQRREAERIGAAWRRRIGLAISAGLAVGLAVGAAGRPLVGGLTAEIVVLVVAVYAYVRAHRAAQALSGAGGGSRAVPAETEDGPAADAAVGRAGAAGLMAVVVLLLAVATASASLAYAWLHYGDMPDRVPMHFDWRGEPDAWAERSFLHAMLLPSVSLITALMMGGVTLLVANARLSVRSDSGRSQRAQLAFRRAVVGYLGLLTLLTVAMLAVGTVSSIEVALGRRAALHPAFMVLGLGIGLVTILGVVYLAFRYGQGGARIEHPGADDRLLGPLADNERWVWGVFYVNREDPAWLVESRFGLGYTLNFGNRRAVAALVGLVLAVVGVLVLAVWAGT